jgi:hypothetical protein|tara:strand:+ start:5733 stop:5882 length:150 start_codon:yes stop_codon:yes gene_type:complete
MTEVICKNCGAIYLGSNIPEDMECVCESKDFEVRDSVMDNSQIEVEAEA